jgi:hypothetical protein
VSEAHGSRHGGVLAAGRARIARRLGFLLNEDGQQVTDAAGFLVSEQPDGKPALILGSSPYARPPSTTTATMATVRNFPFILSS